MLENISCPICHSKRFSDYLSSMDHQVSGEPFFVVKCLDCFSVYTNPRVSESQIYTYYPATYTSYKAQNRYIGIQYIKKILQLFYQDENQKIGNLFKTNNVKRILEIGPGNGDLLDYLRNVGFHVEGIEIDEKCVEQIKSIGISCYKGRLSDAAEGLGNFDAIIMRQVLEHIYDPPELINTIHRVLVKGGILYLTVPNIDAYEAKLFGGYWKGLDLPRHITHFSRDTIIKLLSSNHFEAIDVSDLVFPSSFIESIGFCTWGRARFSPLAYYFLYYIWKLLTPLHMKMIGSGVIRVIAKKGEFCD